jgi:hypothetical protein
MPLILAPSAYARWLSDELDPYDLLQPFPAEPMRMWPISARVNKPENDDPSIVEPITLTASVAWLSLRCRRGAHEIALANLNAALPNDVVGCGSVKIEVWQAVSE